MQADVFCRVIDNYGDIGVAWRLARQLQLEQGWLVRLWVDDLKSFQRLEPRISLVAQQELNGIEVIDWNLATDFTPGQIVIATFSCDLPEPYVEKLRVQATASTSTPSNPASSGTPRTLWINLEYLSAEEWVEGCHQLPSLRSDGLSSHFFFPGFTAQTGGLLRESDLIAQRDAWQADRAAHRVLLENLGLSQTALDALFPRATSTPRARLVNLFCYPHAPVDSLIAVLSAAPQTTVLLIPEGIHIEYQTGQYGQLCIERIPFLPQTEYDKILWTADLNFVRGEDSIVRGIWAGKPLIWQIYPQTENTHLEKLQAWLTRTGLPDGICTLMMRWNPESTASDSVEAENLTPRTHLDQDTVLSGYKNINEACSPTKQRISNVEFARRLQQQLQPENFDIWREHARQLCDRQAALPDLAATLTAFCKSKAILPQKG